MALVHSQQAADVVVQQPDSIFEECNAEVRVAVREPKSKYLRLVEQQAATQPHAQFCAWLDERVEETDSRTFAQAWSRAGAVAVLLATEGVRRGDRVILCFNFGLDFLDAFLGCLRLGAIAVPVYPPNPSKLQDGLKKLALIVLDCSAKVGLMDKQIQRLRNSTRGWPTGMVWIVPKVESVTLLHRETSIDLDAALDMDIAFLQYTSGSTGDPKGVILTFENIYQNLQLSNFIFGPNATDEGVIGCSWLPQFHDLGLLFCTLYPLARGRKQIFFSPAVFIKSPTNWLVAISKYRCTWTTCPNFAYGLAARKFRELPAAKRPELNLSCMRGVGSAAEPIRRETMVEFVDTFKDHGLLENGHFFAAYGLAENTVSCFTVSQSLSADPTLSRISDSSSRFVFSGEVPHVPGAEERVWLDARVVVDGREVEDGSVGELWVRSASKGLGYWGLPERSAETFEAELREPRSPLLAVEGVDPLAPPHFLRTGDEAFFEVDAVSGRRRIFVCGRSKDLVRRGAPSSWPCRLLQLALATFSLDDLPLCSLLPRGSRLVTAALALRGQIIIRGKNVYPQDVEQTGERAAGGFLRLNCSAAFQSQQADGGGDLEAADLVCEVKEGTAGEGELGKRCEAMAAAVRTEHGLRLRRVVLIRARSIPKTTSGKIRRKETKRALMSGELMARAVLVWEDASVEKAREDSAEGGGEEGSDGEGEVAPPTEEAFVAATLEEACEAAGCDAQDIDVHEHSLAEMGLESMSAGMLSQRLSQRLGVEVAGDELISACTIHELALQLLHKRMMPEADGLADLVFAVEEGDGGSEHADADGKHLRAVLPDGAAPAGPSVKAVLPARASSAQLWQRESTTGSYEGDSSSHLSAQGTARVLDTTMREPSASGSMAGMEATPSAGHGETRERDAAGPGMWWSVGTAAGIAVRVLVHASLILFLLTSVYVCALPAVAAMERMTDIEIFPLALFRWLVEPRLSEPAAYGPWGNGNVLSIADIQQAPAPLISSPFLAVPLGLVIAASTFMLCFTAYVVLLKWVLLGRVREGEYPLFGFFYWRRWLVLRHVELLMLILSPVLQDAAPLAILYTLLGARIGWGSKVTVFALADLDFDLLSVGARASVSGSASLLTAVVSKATLYLRRVSVGEACDVGSLAVLSPGVALPARTRVTTQTVVTEDSIRGGEAGLTLTGRPGAAVEGAEAFGGCGGRAWFDVVVMPGAWLGCMVVQAGVCVLPVVLLHELVIGARKMSGPELVCFAVLDLATYLLSLCVFTVAAKWALLGRMLRAGARIPRHSAAEVARECVHRLQGLVNRFVLSHCWGGACIALWYRAMGARLGEGVVLSLGVSISDWDSVCIGPGSLLGGGCSLETSATCPESGDRLIRGLVLGEAVTCGANTVIGEGSSLGERALVTSLSHLAAGSQVPPHAVVTGAEVKPRWKRCYVPRAGLPKNPALVKEVVAWVLYVGWTIGAVWAALYAVWWVRVRWEWPAMVLFPLGGGLYQLAQLLLVVGVQRTVGRVRGCRRGEGEKEIEVFCFTDFLRVYLRMYLFMAFDGSMLGQLAKGGPLINLYLRALRGTVHINAFINATWLYDQEQVEIGDGAAVNALACVSPHVVLASASARLHRIVIGPGATIWPRATLLGYTQVPPSCQVGPMSRMAPASTSLALEELERRRTATDGLEGPVRVLVGVPATRFVSSGLLGT